MEALGIDEAEEESSALQESLSLKAFLRVNRESRREFLVSSLDENKHENRQIEHRNEDRGEEVELDDEAKNENNLQEHFSSSSSSSRKNYLLMNDMNKRYTSSSSSSSSSSSLFHDKETFSGVRSSSSFLSKNVPLGDSYVSVGMKTPQKNFAISYDPSSDFSHVSPPTDQENYYLEEFRDESKLPYSHNDISSLRGGGEYMSEKDRIKIAENFNAMNTIINSTFKEKIEYQRKLREQQSELNTLNDKIQRLKTENSHLASVITKNKRSHLPMAMVNVFKKRRLAALRRGMVRWIDQARGLSIAYVQKIERDFQKRETEYIQNGKLLILKLRKSALRSLHIIFFRRRIHFFRKAFCQWRSVTSAMSLVDVQKFNVNSKCIRAMKLTNTRRSCFATWKRAWHVAVSFRSHINKLAKCSVRFSLRDSFMQWRRELRRFEHIRQLRACMRTLTRHNAVAKSFYDWKNSYCKEFYHQKTSALWSIWRRCQCKRKGYLRASFQRWSSKCDHLAKCQRGVHVILRAARKQWCRKALQVWSWGAQWRRNSQQLLLHAFYQTFPKNLIFVQHQAFSRWRSQIMSIEKRNLAKEVGESAQRLKDSAEYHQRSMQSLSKSHKQSVTSTLQSFQTIVRMFKALGSRQRTQQMVLLAFKRWSLVLVVGETVRSTLVERYMSRIIIMMRNRLKEKRQNAFGTWKEMVRRYNTQVKIVHRMLHSTRVNSIRGAMQRWREHSWSCRVNAVKAQMQEDKVRRSIEKWQFYRVNWPFQKWKRTSQFLLLRLSKLRSVVALKRAHELRLSLQKWHRGTVLQDLFEHKSTLRKYQEHLLKNIGEYVENAPKRTKSRVYQRWKSYCRHSLQAKKASLLLSQQFSDKCLGKAFRSWGYLYRLRRRFGGGLHRLLSTVKRLDALKLQKRFHLWLRMGYCQDQRNCKNVIAVLEEKHQSTAHKLQLAEQQLQKAREDISQLTNENCLCQSKLHSCTTQRDMLSAKMMSNKSISINFAIWKHLYWRKKASLETLCRSLLRFGLRTLWHRQKRLLSRWKHETLRHSACLKAIQRLQGMTTRRKTHVAFKRWQWYLMSTAITAVQQSAQESEHRWHLHVDHLQQKVREQYHLQICVNDWKRYASVSMKCKRYLKEIVLLQSKKVVAQSFRKLTAHMREAKCLLHLAGISSRIKLKSLFLLWKRKDLEAKKLRNIVQFAKKLRRKSMTATFSTWKQHVHLLSIRKVALRSALRCQIYRYQSRIARAFRLWEESTKTFIFAKHKSGLFARQVSRRQSSVVFKAWREYAIKNVTARRDCERVVFGLTQCMPVVRQLHSSLGSSNSLEEIVSLASEALERVLPWLTPEVYVMVSNTMLRSFVPVGRESRRPVSARQLPLDTPPSPIHQHDVSAHSFAKSHLLTPFPWSEEKKTSSHSPGGAFGQDGAEVVSVIVGRGAVGSCAKSGSYQVNRFVTTSSAGPHPEGRAQAPGEPPGGLASAVLPLMSGNCIVGVLQLTPSNFLFHETSETTDSIAAPLYPSAPLAHSFTYPYPGQSTAANSSSTSPWPSKSQSAIQAQSRFVKSSVAPLPPPQFTELVNMCLDVGITDMSSISELCVLIGALSDTLRSHIAGDIKKHDFEANNQMEKEKLEAYISQLHGEVAAFEESVNESAKRISHLEKSRLRYFNEYKAYKEKAEAFEKSCEGLSETVASYKERLMKYEDKKRLEGEAMEKLHQSLTKASMEVFGTPAAPLQRNEPIYSASRSDNELERRNDDTFESHLRLNTATPTASSLPKNTFTTFDTSSRFSPNREKSFQ